MPDTTRFEDFVNEVTGLVERTGDESIVVAGVQAAMKKLVAADDWLPAAVAKPHPTYYQQYLLHKHPRDLFSVVSFVWGPGQKTPVHDHTVWGVIGMLRGAEVAVPYKHQEGRLVAAGEPVRLEPGHVEAVSPSIGDIHLVRNAFEDRVSISIHCYGADIGSVRRHVFAVDDGAMKDFVSGYANA